MILAPWNPSGFHWVLVVISLLSDEAYFLDPMVDSKCLNDETIIRAQDIFGFLVRKNK